MISLCGNKSLFFFTFLIIIISAKGSFIMLTVWWQRFSHLDQVFCYKTFFFFFSPHPFFFWSWKQFLLYCICTSYGFTAYAFFFLLAYLSSHNPAGIPSVTRTFFSQPCLTKPGFRAPTQLPCQATLCCLPICHILVCVCIGVCVCVCFSLSALYWTHQ